MWHKKKKKEREVKGREWSGKNQISGKRKRDECRVATKAQQKNFVFQSVQESFGAHGKRLNEC